ncbi:MAG: NAD(P)H-dependent oxidoreductase [Treponema sp.]|jgi:flavodoxin|nr:NAD(P)H-dependent oxidoreductase [Treponema sp.]
MKKLLILALTLFCVGAGMELKAQTQTNRKILTVYFSWGGNTRTAARYVQRAVGGDMFEIKTVEAYPTEYRPATESAKREQETNARPALSTRVNNMESYDVIFIGYPIWWGTIPMALFTFLESYDFTGKTIIPFCTHGSSGLGRSVRDIEKLCPDAVIREGLAIRGAGVGNAQDEVNNWLRRLGMMK